MAAAGGGLVYHYNRRITGARGDSDKVIAYFQREAGIDLSTIIPVVQARGDRTPDMYDAEELYIFGYVLAGSILPALCAWVLQ